MSGVVYRIEEHPVWDDVSLLPAFCVDYVDRIGARIVGELLDFFIEVITSQNCEVITSQNCEVITSQNCEVIVAKKAKEKLWNLLKTSYAKTVFVPLFLHHYELGGDKEAFIESIKDIKVIIFSIDKTE